MIRQLLPPLSPSLSLSDTEEPQDEGSCPLTCSSDSTRLKAQGREASSEEHPEYQRTGNINYAHKRGDRIGNQAPEIKTKHPRETLLGQSENKKKHLPECLELGPDRERSPVCSEGDAPVMFELVTRQC